MRFSSTGARVIFAGAGLAACVSCGGGSGGGAAPVVDEYVYDCTNPAADGRFATDESFMAIVDKEAAGAVVRDDNKAPRLTAPVDRALSVMTPPVFTFEVGAQARARPNGGWGRRLWRWLSPVGTAEAHCAGVTGENYIFRLTHPGEVTPVYTVALSVRSFTPDAALWRQKMKGRAGQSLELSIVRAVLSGGAVTEGPFAPRAPIAFAAAP